MKTRSLISVSLVVPMALVGAIVGVKVLTAGSSIRQTVPASGFNTGLTNQESNTKRANIDSMQLVTAKTGWALTLEGQLLLTNNSGGEWSNITPGEIFGARVHGAFFTDRLNGSTVISRAGKDGFTLDFAITHDGGQNWTFNQLGATSDAGYGKASISFINQDVGYVMLQLPSSANFSLGMLFKTADGGVSWNTLPAVPVAGQINFTSATDGWLAGGAGGDKLYFTSDGGQSWKQDIVPSPPAEFQIDQTIYSLPSFAPNSPDGTLIVKLNGKAGSAIGIYQTNNGGATWDLSNLLPFEGQDYSEIGVASSVFDSSFAVALPQNGNDVVITSRSGTSQNNVSLNSMPPGAHVNKISLVGPTNGWVLVSEAHCTGFKTGCVQETRLLALSADNGPLDVTPLIVSTQPNSFEEMDNLATTLAAPGGKTHISMNKGFDKCTAGTVSQMQTWRNSSPFGDTNIYIGGNNRACSQPNLTAGWVDQIATMGWGLIPTWVGPQAPCTTCTTCAKMSSDATTAANQGRAEADSAINAMAGLGLTAGSIAYFDMERYNPSGSCQSAVRAFINGWDQRLAERGFKSGVYGSPGNANDDWAVIANPPLVVWIAKWDGRDTVLGLTPLPDNLFTNHQRIHQFMGGHDETWGGVTFNIDSNRADAPVASN